MNQCEQHGDLMRSIGAIEGSVAAILTDQAKIGLDVGGLYKALERVKSEQTRFYLKLIGFFGIAGGVMGFFIKNFLV